MLIIPVYDAWTTTESVSHFPKAIENRVHHQSNLIDFVNFSKQQAGSCNYRQFESYQNTPAMPGSRDEVFETKSMMDTTSFNQEGGGMQFKALFHNVFNADRAVIIESSKLHLPRL